jgi:hypothetical protein
MPRGPPYSSGRWSTGCAFRNSPFGCAGIGLSGWWRWSLHLAAFPPAAPGQRRFLAAVAADQQETDRFLGAFASIVPPEEYFTLRTMVRILGSRGIRKLTAAGVLSSPWAVPWPRLPGRLPGGGRCGR